MFPLVTTSIGVRIGEFPVSGDELLPILMPCASYAVKYTVVLYELVLPTQTPISFTATPKVMFNGGDWQNSPLHNCSIAILPEGSPSKPAPNIAVTLRAVGPLLKVIPLPTY